MSSRRKFLGQMATVFWRPSASRRRCWARTRKIRFGVIGYGERGQELVRDALHCSNTELAAVCDVYSEQRERAKNVVPAIKTYIDHRLMLEAKQWLQVLIATPQHLHCEHNFVDSSSKPVNMFTRKKRWLLRWTTRNGCAPRNRIGKRQNRWCRSGHHSLFVWAMWPMGYAVFF